METCRHVYLDEGGMFGKPRMITSSFLLSDKDLDDEDMEDIRNYYKGNWTLGFINEYIAQFNFMFPKTPITYSFPEDHRRS